MDYDPATKVENDDDDDFEEDEEDNVKPSSGLKISSVAGLACTQIG
jgi:hypothetical protein